MTLPNIYDEVFLLNFLTTFWPLTTFTEKLHHRCMTRSYMLF